MELPMISEPLASGPDGRRGRIGAIPVQVTALLFFIYAAVRAVMVSLTYDESYTLLHHVLPGVFYPDTFETMPANHHPVNVWTVWCSTHLFGTSELAVRLPSLLAYLLYLVATAGITRKVPSKLLRVAAFLVLNAHPYLVDFFSLARGYAWAHAGMMLAWWALLEQLERGQVRRLWLPVAFSVLATYGSLVLVHFLLAVLAIQTVRFVAAPRHLRRASDLLLAWMLAIAGLAGLLPYVLGAMEGGAFGQGAAGFWRGCISSLAEHLLYDRPSVDDPLVVAVPLVVVLLVVLLATWPRGGRRRWSEGNLVVLTLPAIVLGSMAMQHLLLGTAWPMSRSALFLLPLVLVPLVVMLTGPGAGRWQGVMLLGLAFVFTGHLLANLNMSHTREWFASGEARKLFGLIVKDAPDLAPAGRVITVSSGQQCFGVSEYYRMRLGLEHLSFTERLPDQDFAPADYYLVESWGQELVDHANWELLHHSAGTGTSLFRDRRSLQVRGVAVAHLDQGPEPFAGDAFHGMAQLIWVVPNPAPEPPVLIIGSGMVLQHDERNWITFVLRRRSNGTIVQERMIASKDQTRETGGPEPVSVVLRIDERLGPGDEVRFIGLPYILFPDLHLDDRTMSVWR